MKVNDVKMQVKILGADTKETGKMSLPSQFGEQVRTDLIKRAYLVVKSHERQPYGASPDAGKRQSVEVSKRRKDWRGSYGIGISRIPRKIMLHRGTRFNWTGAFVPSAVGGRAAFPPKAEKVWEQKINIKENRKAIRSAISATVSTELVAKKHKMPEGYPFILSSSFESITTTKDAKKALLSLGLKDELERVSEKKIRAGKGKMRGRKYITKKGPLIVLAGDCKLAKAAINLPGVDIVELKKMNVTHLAPAGIAGRLTLWTESAIKMMEKERLFI